MPRPPSGVVAAAASAATVTVATHDLPLGLLLQILDVPASRLKVIPSAAFSGTTVQGPVSVSKLLVNLAGSRYSEWLGVTDADKAKVDEHIVTAGSLHTKLADSQNWTSVMTDLNAYLTTRVFYATNYFTLADIFLYSTLYIPVSKMNKKGRLGFCHVTRYFDLVQHLCHESGKVTLTELAEIELNAPPDEKLPAPEKKKETPAKVEAEPVKNVTAATEASSSKGKKEKKDKSEKSKVAKVDVKAEKTETPSADKKSEAKADKKAAAKPATKQAETPVEGTPEPERLDIRVGYIISAKRHPDADTLYVEEVDVGEEAPRTVVSGLVKWMPESELQGRKVALLCNLKPVKMRGIESQAMVLATTAPDGSKVELLDAPEAAKAGDRCWFDNHIGSDFSQMPPKKKIFETVQPHLRTDSMGRGTYTVEQMGVKHVSLLRTATGELKARTVTEGSIK